METLRDKGRPQFQKIPIQRSPGLKPPMIIRLFSIRTRATASCRFIMGLMPIVPKHAWEGKAFDETSLVPMTGFRPLCNFRSKSG